MKFENDRKRSAEVEWWIKWLMAWLVVFACLLGFILMLPDAEADDYTVVVNPLTSDATVYDGSDVVATYQHNPLSGGGRITTYSSQPDLNAQHEEIMESMEDSSE